MAPDLARDTEGTIASARYLHERINRPNLFVKIPATAEGVPAIKQMISEGRNINVTLIFSLDRYADVIEAYISGLEACEGDLSRVASVASFFISRVDTEVDRRLDAIGTPEALAQRGKAAVAQGKLAYELFSETFHGPRWDALVARGATVQRPLWASTSTKNPAYPDTLYVDELIGPDTVNTMPDQTIEAFDDHGTVARTVDARRRRGDGATGMPSPASASTSTTSPGSSRTRGWRASSSRSTSSSPRSRRKRTRSPRRCDARGR